VLVLDLQTIGENFYNIRRIRGLTREAVAERAEISDRTYADIERGSVNMRIETALRICNALDVTPDEVFTKNDEGQNAITKEDIFNRLNNCSKKEVETAMRLVSVYLDSISK